MSEPHSGKSRRRFLADMLFLGGGATAAALLANSSSSNRVGLRADEGLIPRSFCNLIRNLEPRDITRARF